MGCIGVLSKVPVEEDKKGLNKTYTLGVEKRPTEESAIKVVEGVFVITSNDDPFDSYDDIKVIGEGSFGVVHKVMSKQNKVIRAMKVLEWDKIRKVNKSKATDLINEVQFVKNLDHPNILKIFELFDYKDKLHIVSEICTGGELFELVTLKGRLKEDVASGIMRQLFSAINFYQSYGIVHSDIKPENILIESKEDLNNGKINCKLIDFGLSSKIGKQTIDSGKVKVLGTLSYMAPEAFEGNVSFKSDIWAAGVVMFFLLEGKLPFRGNTNDDVIKAIKKGEYELMTDTSFEAKDLLSKLLEKDKSKRITAKDALGHRFITKYSSMAANRTSLSKSRVSAILGNIHHFKIDQKLQEIVLGFLVNNILDTPEVKELKDLFSQFDVDGDGRLTQEELIKCLSQIMSEDKAKSEVDKIFVVLDRDKSGEIELSEFIRASIDPKILMTDDNLIRVWNVFDKDRSGKISTVEIVQVIAKDLKVDEKLCQDLMKGVDINGDGELSISEFKKMMRGIFEH